MKHLVIFTFSLLVSIAVFGQVDIDNQKEKQIQVSNNTAQNTIGTPKTLYSYNFSEETGTYNSIVTTGTAITPDDWDDGYYYLDLSGLFSINYDGNTVETFSIGTNGAISMGMLINPSYENDLGGTSNNQRPVIAPLWDDLKFYGSGVGDGLFYKLDYDATDTVLTIEYYNVCRYGENTDAGISFQVKFHSHNDVIEIIYGNMNNLNDWSLAEASIGINNSIGEFISITPGSPATFSMNTANNEVSRAQLQEITQGTIYKFTPHFYNIDMMALSFAPLVANPGNIPIQVKVKNVAVNQATNYSVTVKIYQNDVIIYSKTKSITSVLAAGKDTLIAMPTWNNALYGEYTAVFYVTINGDENAGNDTLTETLDVKTKIAMHNGKDTTCNAMFYDSGLDIDNYQSYEHYVLTIYPKTAGSMVEVTFYEFYVQDIFDYLVIYNGTSTNDEDEIGAYTDEADIGTIRARNVDGALTFYFNSDNITTASGWIAHISCYTPPANDLEISKITPDCYFKGQKIYPQVEITNNTPTNISNFQIHVWDSLGTYDQTITISEALEPFEDASYVMPQWFPSADTNKLFASVTAVGDADNSNDSIETFIYGIQPLYSWNAVPSSDDYSEGAVVLCTKNGDMSQKGYYSSDYLAGGDWTPWGWYGIFYNNKTLVKIDENTGNFTTIAHLSIAYPTGLTYDAQNDILYVSDYNNSASRLYKVNIETGSVNLIGNICNCTIIGIAANADGDMYGINLENTLMSIDASTATGTIVGNLGVNLNYMQDIGFDRDKDILYGTLYATDSDKKGLYTINVNTGTATQLYKIKDELTCTAIPYTPHGNNNIVIHVTDTSGNDIPDAQVDVFFASNKIATDNSDMNGNTSFALSVGNYDIKVNHHSFYSYDSEITISGDSVLEVKLIPVQRQVTFHVTNVNGDNFQNATITLDTNTGITNAGGNLTFNVIDGNYNYTVSATNYATHNSTISITQDTIVEVCLYELRQVVFHVKDINGNDIENATVTLDTNSGNTDANGNITFSTIDGTYEYSVSASGFDTVRNIFIISKDTTVEVTLGLPSQQVTIHVINTNGDNIENATVTVGTHIGTTDNNGNIIFAIPNDRYVYTISATSYIDKNGTFTVTKDTTIEISLEYIQRQVTFYVTNSNGENIENATVSLDTSSGTTDADGNVTLYAIDGNHNYNVLATNYAAQNGSFTVTKDTTIEISLECAQRQVTFHITNTNGDNIENANVSLDTITATTDADGNVTFSVTDGNYNYTISATSYIGKSGNLTVTEDTTIEISLEYIQRIVTFHVTNSNGEHIENATVSLDTINGTTDNNGYITFIVADGNYNYSISADNYATINNFIEISKDTIIEINLVIAQRQVTFHITNTNGENVENATVSLDTTNATTNADGNVTFSVIDGNYNYNITADNYAAYSGFIEVSKDTTVEIVLMPTSILLLGSNTKIYPNPVIDKLIIEVDRAWDVEIINSEGKILIHSQIMSKHTEVDITALSRGLYFVKLTNKEEIKVGKIIKL